MPQYEHLTDDEIVNLAGQRQFLTPEALPVLDTELRKRNITPEALQSYQEENDRTRKAEELRIGSLGQSLHGVGRKLLGKAHVNDDALSGYEQYDTTLWFVLFEFPLVPIAHYTVKRKHRENWWEWLWPGDDPVVLRKLPLDWGQILATWAKAIAVVVGLAVLIPLILRMSY
jgi:hypothetical protein